MSHALGLLRRAIQLVIIAMFAVLIATVFYQVIGRYLFNAPPSWSEELARFLQVWIALLASALCIQQSMHLGVDYLLYAVPPRGRAALEVLVHLMVSGFLLLLLVQGIKILDVASVQPSPATEITMWYAYLALPVGAAPMLLEGGMARRIISFAGALLGQFRASLAMIAVGATMLISGVSGSGTADTAAVGSVMIPAMMKRGYEPRFVTAIQAAAGALGPIIPPSIIMVVLGSVTNTSIGQLFIGGIIPGIMIGGFLLLVCYVHARRGGAAYEATERFSWGRVWTTF